MKLAFALPGAYRKAGLALVAIAAPILAAIFVSGVIEATRLDQGEVSATLRALKQYDAELDQELVLARHDLLPHYDPLGADVDILQARIDTLDALLAAHAPWPARVAGLRDALDAKTSDIEDFKRANALLKNSLRYLPQAQTEVAATLRDAGREGLAIMVGQTGRELLSWNLTASPELAEKISAGIDAIEREAEATPWRDEVVGLARHMRLVVEQKPALDAMLAGLIAAPLEARIVSFEAAWQAEVKVRDTRREQQYFGLALLSVLLFALLYYFARRLRANTARLRHEATHDALTGLGNRTQLHEDMRRATHDPRQCGPFALMLMDLDRFKEVNDTLGHHTGDALLRKIGPRLLPLLPEGSRIARLGGDEFALLACKTRDAETALATGARLREALRQPFELDGMSLEVSASIGIALYPEHGADSGELLRRADVAMYAAKRGAGCLVYDVAFDAHSPRRLALMSDPCLSG
jgi:diguanylate cyclase (GGDEF)-like protein